jgi:ATP-dependent protease Clp ATPase subunit
MEKSESNGIKSERRCSFCGKNNSEVRKILSGLDANICNACVAIYTEYFVKKAQEKPKPRCSFCNFDNRELIESGVANICVSCIELCNEMIK